MTNPVPIPTLFALNAYPTVLSVAPILIKSVSPTVWILYILPIFTSVTDISGWGCMYIPSKYSSSTNQPVISFLSKRNSLTLVP